MSVSLSGIINLPGISIASNLSALPGASLLPNRVLSRRSQFIQVLDQWWSTPAMSYLWVIVFTMPSLLTDANMLSWGENIGLGNWGVDQGIAALHDNLDNQPNFSGCMFAQEVEIPGERSNIEYVGQYNRGFTYGPVMNARRAPQKLRIKLLETNSSFVDSIVRPWVILGAHYGMVARQEGTIKSNLMIYELAKSGDYTSDVILRKSWLFQDCVPDSVDDTTKLYTPDNPISLRETIWGYSRYQVVNNFPSRDQILQITR